jgi:hypothetical protein
MSSTRKLFLFLGIPLLLIFGVVFIIANRRATVRSTPSETVVETSPSDSTAVAAGKQISHTCKGEGVPSKLTHLPMAESDFSVVIPYGLMVGGHVTPIDHQYFAPADYNSKRDQYKVYAMGDATITDIQPRTTERGTEYRFVFSITCTYFYYYDLVTSLAPDIKTAFDKGREVNIPVKAGDLVGYIGGQTLDFAVWDTTKPLTGFIYPEHYKAENWKLYTADPLNYYTDELKAIVTARNSRTVEPASGKIDYDIDGKLIGNWFQEGTNWYGGKTNGTGGEYWGGHLAFAPDHYDPSHFVISIGDFGGQALQFMAVDNQPKPETVSIESGLVKYSLTRWQYNAPNGTRWNGTDIIKNPTVELYSTNEGCALVQLKEAQKLTFEAFPKQSCAAITGFTDKAKTYVR